MNLKQVIKEQLMLYLEGKAEDLVKKFPELEPYYIGDDGIKNPSYLQWVLKRRQDLPAEVVVPVIKKFDAEKNRIKQAGGSADIFSYKTFSVLLQTIEGLGSSKSSELKRIKNEQVVYIGQFGDWSVTMPLTREASCTLGKDTTWCTAATDSDSSNYFYKYMTDVKKQKNVILFYVTKKGGNPRNNPGDKLAIGFVEGEASFDSNYTRDAKNDPLSIDDFRNLLKDQASPVMDAMKSHVDSLEGIHPLKKQMQQISMSDNPGPLIDRYTAGLVADEKIEFMDQLVSNYDLGPAALSYISKQPDTNISTVLINLAGNENTPPEDLDRLSRHQDIGVVTNVLENPSTGLKTLSRFIRQDTNAYLLLFVASHPSLTPELIDSLASLPIDERDDEVRIKGRLARNPKATEDTLIKLVQLNDSIINHAVARNPSASRLTLMALSKGAKFSMRYALSLNPSTPVKLLTRYAKSKNYQLRSAVAGNESTPYEILLNLSKDKEMHVVGHLFKNRSTPSQMYKDFIAKKTSNRRQKNEKREIVYGMALSSITPRDVLEIIASFDGVIGKTAKQKLSVSPLRENKFKQRPTTYFEGISMQFTEKYIKQVIREEIQLALDEKKKKKACKPAKGKRFAKRVNGKCRSFGQSGQAKSGGDRIRPGTKKGDAYCARSAKIKKCKNPPCANALSRKKWKCRGSKSMK